MMPWLISLMFVPSLWSIGYLTIFNRKAWKFVRFWPGNPLYLLLAAFIPACIAFATLAIVVKLNWGSSSFFHFAPFGAAVLHGPWVMGNGDQGWAFFAVNVAATAILFACLNGLTAVGEEFGWRGVLHTHFIARFGFLRGVTLLGFIWAIWHVPMNLAGYNYADAPMLGTFVLFPLKLIAVSFIMAWLTLRVRSFWPAMLMHGSGNGIEEAVVSSLTLKSGIWPLTGYVLQIGVTIALALICILLTPKAQSVSDANA